MLHPVVIEHLAAVSFQVAVRRVELDPALECLGFLFAAWCTVAVDADAREDTQTGFLLCVRFPKLLEMSMEPLVFAYEE
jgi:hypothetical protein